MSVVRLGRALLGGRSTSLAQLGNAAYRLGDLMPGTPEAVERSLDPIFQDWQTWGSRIRSLQTGTAQPVEVPYEAFLAPVERPLHLLCIGTNYRDHIAEMGIATDPQYPYAFLKPLTTMAAPSGPVMLPAVSTMVDWEAELGVVIGRLAKDVDVRDALDHVAGYLPLNDVSARDWVENRPNLGIDWVMQKASDGFTPMGPWVTLSEGIAEPQGLPVRCLVNDEVMQDSSTSNMLFSVAEIIAHVSRYMTLSPGDVIATGTPAGVGFGMRPRRFIADGDVVTVSIGDLGDLRTRFIAKRPAGATETAA